MNFRTEIQIPASKQKISHDQKIVMLGSCFTDNIGAALERDGFSVIHNPMGPLYNPLSLLTAIQRACGSQSYTKNDLVQDVSGTWHCLDFASRYSHADGSALLSKVNKNLEELGQALHQAQWTIITLGTAWHFLYEHNQKRQVAGNCHKLPASMFERRCMTVPEIADTISSILSVLGHNNIVFTVSPIRHLADGAHGNQLSKASLLLGLNQAIQVATATPQYFPAYEIMMDDLRDYRFYASDMNHPSDTAIEYIYEKFSDCYFTPATKERAKKELAKWKLTNHRPLL